MTLQVTRRRWLAVTICGGCTSALAGCAGDSDVVIDDEAHSREHWRFDLEEGDTIQIRIAVLERGDVYDQVNVELETVGRGTIEEWSFPFDEEEEVFIYTAEEAVEHTLKVYGMNVAEVTVMYNE